MRTCERCGAEFSATMPNRRYCSESCRAKAERARKWVRRSGHTAQSECVWCGAAFAVQPCAVSRGRGRFCCKSHAAAYGNWLRFGPLTSVLTHRSNRKAREAMAPGHHTRAEWVARLAEYGGLCAYGCGRSATSKDHVIPISKGGCQDIDNIVPACLLCNSYKRDLPLSCAVVVHEHGQTALAAVYL